MEQAQRKFVTFMSLDTIPGAGELSLSMRMIDSTGKAVFVHALVSAEDGKRLRGTHDVTPVMQTFLAPMVLALLNQLDPPAAEEPIAP